jgi:hypothetical protein
VQNKPEEKTLVDRSQMNKKMHIKQTLLSETINLQYHQRASPGCERDGKVKQSYSSTYAKSN